MYQYNSARHTNRVRDGLILLAFAFVGAGGCAACWWHVYASRTAEPRSIGGPEFSLSAVHSELQDEAADVLRGLNRTGTPMEREAAVRWAGKLQAAANRLAGDYRKRYGGEPYYVKPDQRRRADPDVRRKYEPE